MHYQFLIEDRSGAELIHQIMQKVSKANPEITYDCKPFHGIGNFPKGKTPKDIKTGHLLTDLAVYLRGFNKSLRGIPAAIVVVVDNDDRDTDLFYEQLETVADTNLITVDHVFCIAVEELEAWLLGDEAAIISAYPNARMQPIKNYKQDSICGTWEVLADALYRGGHAKLRQSSPYYGEIGRLKCEWARNIGAFMDIHNNKSPSFNRFIFSIESRLQSAKMKAADCRPAP